LIPRDLPLAPARPKIVLYTRLEVPLLIWKDKVRTESISGCSTLAIADVHRHSLNNSMLSNFGEAIVGIADWEATKPRELSKDLSIIVTISNRCDGHPYQSRPIHAESQ
jgi:hypothetical protein